MDEFADEIQRELLKFEGDAELEDACNRLDGEVLGLETLEGGRYRLKFERGTIINDDSLEPTIRIRASQEVILQIVRGELDPLIAIITGRLHAKIDPKRGPLLRLIFFEKSRCRRQAHARATQIPKEKERPEFR